MQEGLGVSPGGSARMTVDKQRVLHLAPPPSSTSAPSVPAHTDTAEAEAGSSDEDDGVEVLEAGSLEVVVLTHAVAKDAYAEVLESLCPDAVVLYDADLALVRAVEAAQCHRRLRGAPDLAVYFVMVAGSIEEHRYVQAVAGEKRAFQQLVTKAAALVVGVPDDAEALERDRRGDVVYAADTRTLEVVESSKRARLQAGPGRVVVDARELRSTLPNILHAQGVELRPVTLAIGDYVLAPTIAVERKVLPLLQ